MHICKEGSNTKTVSSTFNLGSLEKLSPRVVLQIRCSKVVLQNSHENNYIKSLYD